MSSETPRRHSANPAQTLSEAARQLDLAPLTASDPLYTPLDLGRGTKELSKMERFLRNAAENPDGFAKCAFVGGRGAGKSTFLFHLEERLRSEKVFTPVHVTLDPSLEADCDYTDLFLWMVDEIARQFADAGHPVDEAKLSDFAEWFAEKTNWTREDWNKEIGLETEAKAEGGAGLPGIFSLKLLARLKSRIVGSHQDRIEIRRHVQRYASELLEKMNDFLDHARKVLSKKGHPARLLIVQDNLDRMKSSEARRFFETGTDMLLGIRADIIYTAPLALNLAPLNLGQSFHVFTMPNVKVRLKEGKPYKPGLDALVELIRKRLSIDLLFANGKVPSYLAEKSGGSLRDLIRLLGDAALTAQVDGKERIDMESAKAAVRKISVGFIQMLRPGSTYYPILAEVHHRKTDFAIAGGEATPEKVASARAFFAELINNGTVLEYNGEDSWYDVHPALCDTEGFKDALAKIHGPTGT